nr:hypothetical protein [Tanacetum cinerariifolium]
MRDFSLGTLSLVKLLGYLILKPEKLKRIWNQTDKNTCPRDTNGNAGTQDNVDVGKEVSDQHYIVLPLWSSISSTYKSSDDKAEDDKPKDDTGLKTVVKPVNKKDQAYRDALERLMSQEKEAIDAADSLSNEFEQGCMDQRGATKAGSTNSFNTVSNPVNAASTSGTFSAGGPSYPHPDAFIPDDTLLRVDQDDSQIPDLEDTAELKMVECEGSENPPESQPTPSPTQPISESQIPESSSSSQNTQSPRQTLEGTGFSHQGTHPSIDVEAVHKEGIGSLVMAATTASLDAQQDSSNIAKTQSKATLNEPNPQGEGSVSGPGRQKTMGSAMAQIRFEGAPIQSSDPLLLTGNIVGSGENGMGHAIELTNPIPQTPHDSPLSEGHAPGSDEGSMTLKELTNLFTTLSQKVLDLKNVKTAQAKVIVSLQKRITKLEQRQSSRISGFHPFRADTSRRHSLEVIVEDKGSGEKGGSIAETVSTARPDISVARPEVSTDEPKTPPTTTTLFDDEDVTIADTLVKMKSQKAKEKGVAFKDTKKRDQDQIERDVEVSLKIQAELDEEVMTERERQEEASKAALAELYDEVLKKMKRELEVEKKRAACSSSKQKSPKKKKVLGTMVAGDVHVYKLSRLNGSYKHFSTFSRMLKVLDRQDVFDFHKIVMERFPANDPKGYDLILWGDLKTLMESSEDDEIWKNQQDWKLLSWKLYETCGVHTLIPNDSLVSINMFVEKKYPLTKEILKKMLSWRLEAKTESILSQKVVVFLQFRNSSRSWYVYRTLADLGSIRGRGVRRGMKCDRLTRDLPTTTQSPCFMSPVANSSKVVDANEEEDTVVMVVVVDDTPIVIDKLVRVTSAFQKEDTVARKNLSFVNLR